MGSKLLKFDDEARSSILDGIETLAKAVKVTMGPRGRVVAIDKAHGFPSVTKDGVTVAESITLADPFENMGARLVQEVASKTCTDGGDGTTTSTVLVEAIYREGLKAITSGVNPVEMKRGIDKAVKAIVEQLKEQAIDVSTDDEIKQIATISANGDEKIGALIAEAMESVGKNGNISVQPSKSIETSLSVVKGMNLEGSGYLSPYFATDAKTLNTEYDDAFILLLEDKVTNMMDILPILQQVSQAGKPLLIISEDIEGEALSTLVMNTLKGTITACAVKAPYFGEMRKGTMDDISILTGAKYITKDLGLKLSEITLADLGVADHVTVTKNETTIFGGQGKQELLEGRVQALTDQLKTAEAQHIINQLTDRRAKLDGGIAVLNIGGSTETEMNELKDRVDDALSAVRAGVAEGIVAGGGVALLNAVNNVENVTTSAEEVVGAQIVFNACRYPFDTIVANAGKNGEVIKSKIDDLGGDFGYDARNDEYVKMVESGIIDPVKVTRLALENAASIAGLLLTTEVLITDKPEIKSAVTPQPQVMM